MVIFKKLKYQLLTEEVSHDELIKVQSSLIIVFNKLGYLTLIALVITLQPQGRLGSMASLMGSINIRLVLFPRDRHIVDIEGCNSQL